MGHFLATAERRGWRPVGLEVSASGCAQVERLKAERRWTFQVRQGDVVSAEFPAASFRAVILIEVLEHLRTPLACLRNIHSWLEPGGVLYLTTPGFDSLSRYVLAGRWRAIGTEYVRLFNPRTLRAALEVTGFRPVRLVTKNIDLPEIVAKWRRPPAPEAFATTAPSTEAFRRSVEGSSLLRSVKSAVNAALRRSRLGESLEALTIRDSEGGAVSTW